MARKSLSKRLRFEVFKRDRFTCQYCGRRPPDVMLEADHIVAVAEGGGDEAANLTTSCQDCNRGKAANGLGAVMPALDEEARLEAMQEMLERKALLKRELEIVRAKDEAEEELVYEVWTWWLNSGCPTEGFQASSVKMFLRRMTLAELRDCVEAARGLFEQKPHASPEAIWKYFCGAAWKMIRANEGT